MEIVTDKVHKINKLLATSEIITHGFYGGSLGLLFYYFSAGEKLADKNLTQKANQLLDKVFEDMNDNAGGLNGISLSNGGAGLAAVVNYLQKNNFIEFDIDEEFKEIDKFLFNNAIALLDQNNVDYLHGPLGVILYFSKRNQNVLINSYLNILVDKLLGKAIETPHGIWFKNKAFSERNIENKIDFGLAHGLTGILLILIAAYPHLIDKKACENIIRQGISFIVKHELPVYFDEGEYSYFPTSFDNDDINITRFNRLAWCYGDLNEVLLLYRAGNLFNDNRYLAIANRIGLKSVERKSETSTLSVNTHFCHGSSGIAQFYKAIFYETNNEIYKKAYEYWLRDIINRVDKEIEDDIYVKNNASFLEGWAGVAFVLLDVLSFNKKSEWAGLFLL